MKAGLLHDWRRRLTRSNRLRADTAAYFNERLSLPLASERCPYVRVPIVTEASIEADNKRIASSTLEVSAGGMSLVCSSKLHLGHSVQISFALPSTLSGGNLKVKASVCWARENENAYGVRFDVTDDRRLQVKRWIDDYLQI